MKCLLCVEHYIQLREEGTGPEAGEPGLGRGPERSFPCHCPPVSLTRPPRRVELLARVRSTAGSQECGLMGHLLWQHCCPQLSQPSGLPPPILSSPPPQSYHLLQHLPTAYPAASPGFCTQLHKPFSWGGGDQPQPSRSPRTPQERLINPLSATDKPCDPGPVTSPSLSFYLYKVG